MVKCLGLMNGLSRQGIVVATVVGLFGFFMSSKGFSLLQKQNKSILTPHLSHALPEDVSIRKSVILAYDSRVLRQAIQATPLRRNELVPVNEEDDALDDSLVILDKVVVIPRDLYHE